jgi:hypothetical protein
MPESTHVLKQRREATQRGGGDGAFAVGQSKIWLTGGSNVRSPNPSN